MEVENKKIKVFLATGGSGGHIFPAISIAERLVDDGNDVCIIADKIYKKYSTKNIDYKIIDAGKTLKSFSDIKDIITGFFQALKLIKSERPNAVVGFGSYATLPTLMACVLTNTPYLLHEQNAYIGKVNKVFGRNAKKIMTTYHELFGVKFADMEKIIYTGSPVRKRIKGLKNITYSYPKNNEKFIVLITGGSSGAKVFSELLPKIFDLDHSKEQKNLKIYHQVREEFVENVEEYYKQLGLDAIVQPFFDNIDELLSKAHLIIGRAGSGTLCETAVAGKPSILIPLTSRGNNRQEVNAQSFAKNNASLVVLEKDFNVKDFQKLFFDLVKDSNRLEEMSKNVRKIAVVDADENILKILKNVIMQ